MNKFPTVSIYTGSLNPNLKIFKRVLEAIKRQTYKNVIEHIIMDGGSTNGSIELAKKYGCIVDIRPHLKLLEQIRFSEGLKRAKGDLVLCLETDNIPTSKEWLSEMVQPFIDNKKVFCTFSAYNGYEKKLSATTRYGAFFGAADPTLYYLKKSDKIPLLQKNYDKGKIIDEKPGYWIVEFDKNTLPTMGDNGHMFRSSAMNKVNRDPALYVHPDSFVDMLAFGYDTCGVVKNTVIHIIPPNILNYAKRRAQVKSTFYDARRGKRKYLVFDWNSKRDKINLVKFAFFSLTIVEPLYQSTKGYIRLRDSAWFLHPIMSILMLAIYSFSELRWALLRILK